MKNARTLGLVLALALALTASVGAASASAVEFVSGSEYNYIRGQAGTQIVLTTTAQGSQKCKATSESGDYLSGFFKGKTASSLTLQSTADLQCNAGTLKMNGCKFILHPGASTFDIGPEACGPIGVTALNGQYMTIGWQNGVKAKYSNQGSGSSASVLFDKEGLLKYTLWNGSPETGLTNPQSYADLTWSGSTVLRDYTDIGPKAPQIGWSVK